MNRQRLSFHSISCCSRQGAGNAELEKSSFCALILASGFLHLPSYILQVAARFFSVYGSAFSFLTLHSVHISSLLAVTLSSLSQNLILLQVAAHVRSNGQVSYLAMRQCCNNCGKSM
ncbi:unnamed protein product [Symbiodinium natans]|uniref:Uncharacterized protein n=1 Tax=Symbiodinium natans TaxID=878477 RepID=A0A812R218_9DINO|nr:unnamed protein product [Symbiodinium natans]